METTARGWLLDLYDDDIDGVRLWFILDDGQRICLHHQLAVSFYVAGPTERLHQICLAIRNAPGLIRQSRAERRDVFKPDAQTVLQLDLDNPVRQRNLFLRLKRDFPDLTYYDADLGVHIQHAARHGTFPLALCDLIYDPEILELIRITPINTRWDIGATIPVLRQIELEPTSSPVRTSPPFLHVTIQNGSRSQNQRIKLDDPVRCLERLNELIADVNPDILAALVDTPVKGDIPAFVLYRLPEWSLYVDTADAIPGISGFYVHLEWDANTSRAELRFLIRETGGDLFGIPVHIGNWTVEESTNRVLKVSDETLGTNEVSTNPLAPKLINNYIQPLLSITLYLCSAEPEIDTDLTQGWSPYKAAPVKTKSGPRLFPADKWHNHTVGAEMGAKIRAEYSDAESERIDWQGGTKRAHLRRGHWHGFWRGKRGSDEQEFFYRWLHPLLAGGKRKDQPS